jgi:hypothetical protein
LDSHHREILLASLRRVDQGDEPDSILRDYPQDAEWLRDYLAFSAALSPHGEPSPEKKNRARESILYAVAHSDPPSVTTRLRLNFAVAHAGLIVAGCLALTAGAAAASGTSLRSAADDVVDALAEPLALLDEVPHDAVIPDLENRRADTWYDDSRNPTGQSDDNGLGDEQAVAVLDSAGTGTPPAPESPQTQIEPPDSGPQANQGTPSLQLPSQPTVPVPAEESPPVITDTATTPPAAPPDDAPEDESPGSGPNTPGQSPGNEGQPPNNEGQPSNGSGDQPANGGNPPGNIGNPPGTEQEPPRNGGDELKSPGYEPPSGGNHGGEPSNQPGDAGHPTPNPNPNSSGPDGSKGESPAGQNGGPNDPSSGGSSGSKPKTGGPSGKGGSV